MRVLIAIPTYNEADNIARIVRSIWEELVHIKPRPYIDFIIVDDSSPDGTGRIVTSLQENLSWGHHIILHSRKEKDGLASAYWDAFRYGIDNGYTHVLQCDADGSHRPCDVRTLVEKAAFLHGKVPCIIGSRYIRGGKAPGWSKARLALSLCGNVYIRMMLGVPVRDISAGLRMYRLDILSNVMGECAPARGYFFQSALTYALWEYYVHSIRIYEKHRFPRRHYSPFLEVPIVFLPRQQGKSKLTFAIFMESYIRSTQIGLKRLYAYFRHFTPQNASMNHK